MRLLLLGPNGQVGWELQRALAPLGDVIPAGRDGPHGCDLASPESLRPVIRALRPDIIVNAAAYTAVDAAESDGLAETVNATAVGVMAEEAAAAGALLVHYGTDYVFDGSGERPWREDDPPSPLNRYGATKLDGERRIAAAGCRHLVFRTSWVHASRGKNFIRTMLRLGAERDTLTVVADQVGAPTGAELIADVSAHAIVQALGRPALDGIYHLAAAGETSWHGLAAQAFAVARAHGHALRITDDALMPIPTTAYPTPARRPLNSRLSTDRLQATFRLRLPPWQDGVTRTVRELLGAT